MDYGLFEDQSHRELRPFTYTRPLWALRSGVLTLAEKWTKTLGAAQALHSADFLAPVWSLQTDKALLWFNGKFVPDEELIRLGSETAPNSGYVNTQGEILVAHFDLSKLVPSDINLISAERLEEAGIVLEQVSLDPIAIRQMPDIFRLNAELIRFDWPLLTRDRPSEPIGDPHSIIYGRDNIYVAAGAKIKAAILNAEDGPIYIGPESVVEEGALIRGTHGLTAHVTVNAGARLRGDSTFGPHVKVGGEVSNSVIMGYSSKGHDGYLGNSVLGYWCNLGADSNNSNLKNNYADVKIWNYPEGRFKDTGLQFCGLMMGDHSKCGINTMFNTGTVVGVSANIYGSGFPRNFIPSFAWGGASGFMTYRLDKALQTAELVMGRRGKSLSKADLQLMQDIFDHSQQYRFWEKTK